MRRFLLLGAVAALLAPTATPAHAAEPSPLARTETGLVRGVTGDGYRAFHGLPYAAPPTGPNRWRAPQPAAPWAGVRDATGPGPVCAQNSLLASSATAGSEDCLYLDVTAPATGSGRHPVLVFLHGGSFTTGSGSQYDPHRLAAAGDLVVVTINYRLGVFGYLGLPGLAGSGTFGLQDQQAALRWVRRNIAAFGGDPRNVTLDGESAGGMSVCAQMTSPAAAGLFGKAIIQSGSCLTDWPDGLFLPGMPAGSQFSPLAAVRARGTELGARFGCADVACLRAVPADELLAATKGAGLTAVATPAYGTPLLPARPADALRAGRYHRVPVLQGGNLDEHRGFIGVAELYLNPAPFTPQEYETALRSAFGERAGEVEALYPIARWGTPGLAWAAVGTDRIWACPTLEEARLFGRAAPAYGYEYRERNGPMLDGRFPWGAAHGYELPYLFDMEFLTGQADPDLAARFVAAWARFATTGSPGWPRLPHVEAFAVGRSGNVDVAAEHRCDFWAGFPHA